ncbi:hypothetical protein G4177_08060 [Corallococcus sp. ZKHCc1 1396]|uniref:Uncharacterized protein n=1 Tax=Corallococcus soli TaxID=2710757 RepID=A0ABR9PJT9_9BACT|nr:hypothetical protein [Corallococcus soli]MBE4748134.1 hypothetical protein [Corallococcus soli]
MAISPLSKSSVPSPALSRTPATGQVAPLQQVATDAMKSGALEKGLGLRGQMQQDGFDSLDGAGKGGGMEKLGKMLAMLGELSKLLGAEGLGGAQGASGGNTGVVGPNNIGNTGVVGPNGAAMGLGAQGDSFDGGVPDLGGESAAFGGEPAVAGAQGASQSQGGVTGKNTMTLHNDGTTPMKVNFTPNAGEKAVDAVTLKPGESRTVQFPDGWSGNFRTDAGDGKNATLGEVKFDGGHGKTYYDVSYIEGHNAAMTMQPQSGGRLSGTTENLLASAPDSVKAKGADGQAYGIKKSTTSNVQDPEVVDFFRKHVGADQGYVIPTDDASTLGSSDSNLVVHLKNLA